MKQITVIAVIIIVPTIPAEIIMQLTGKWWLLWLFGLGFDVECGIPNKNMKIVCSRTRDIQEI